MIHNGLRATPAPRLVLASRPLRRRLPQIDHKFAAFAATGAIAAMAFTAIQLFGDPDAAGPRSVLSLAPSAAAADAPHVSFSEAVDETGGVYAPYGLDGPAYGGERVAVAEAAQTLARRSVAPLARAPLAGLTERGPNGVLPIVAANGRTPAQAYARPFTPAQGRPTIAIVISGLGFNAAATTQAIEELPPEVTLSFVPYARNLQSWIDRARARGHEVLLELPMEPFDPVDDTGPQTLLAEAPAQQNVSRLEHLLSRGAGYFGVTNYQGSRFATSAEASAPVVQALRRRGLVFVSSGIGEHNAFSIAAQRADLPNTAADSIIDARQEASAIGDELLNLEALALQNQSAIGAGFAYPGTMEQVGRWARDIHTRGYQLAPASAVLNARAARR